jgi:hypothetical protein
MTNAPDLRARPPRRWSEEIGGIRWLPRLIDKARAAVAGTLGDYLFGQSPMDRGLLRALRLRHRELAAIVRISPDDAAVLEAIERRDPSALDRARVWSEPLAREHRLFFWLLDVDDGSRTAADWLGESRQTCVRMVGFYG